MCEREHHSGIGQDGFYAPYAALTTRAITLVPDSEPLLYSHIKGFISYKIDIPSSVAAVATDAVITSYHAITRRAEVKPSETVFLFGLGGLGFNGLQAVLRIGARVIISDVRQERLDAAKKIGVPEVDIVPIGKSVQDFVLENSLSGKIDTVLDFVGKNQTFQDAQAIGKFLLSLPENNTH